MLLILADVTPVEESVNLFSLLQRGGPLMAVLFVLSIVATGVLIERLVFFRRSKMNVNEFLSGILSLVAQGRYGEAMKITEEGHGPVVRVVSTAISKRALPPAELREVVREIAQLEIPRLESNLSMLATIGYIAPLFGLLGTVIGLIETFIHLNRTSGASSIAELSAGIYTALITPAAGLSLAIPCFLAYNFLVTQMQSIISDMERAGIEVIHALTDSSRKSAASLASTAPNGAASTPPGKAPAPGDAVAGSKAFGQA